MHRLTDLCPWIFSLAIVTSLAATKAPDVEFSLYQHNETHILAHTKSDELGHHRDLLLPREAANYIPLKVKPQIELHASSEEQALTLPSITTDQGIASSVTARNPAALSSVTDDSAGYPPSLPALSVAKGSEETVSPSAGVSEKAERSSTALSERTPVTSQDEPAESSSESVEYGLENSLGSLKAGSQIPSVENGLTERSASDVTVMTSSEPRRSNPPSDSEGTPASGKLDSSVVIASSADGRESSAVTVPNSSPSQTSPPAKSRMNSFETTSSPGEGLDISAVPVTKSPPYTTSPPVSAMVDSSASIHSDAAAGDNTVSAEDRDIDSEVLNTEDRQEARSQLHTGEEQESEQVPDSQSEEHEQLDEKASVVRHPEADGTKEPEHPEDADASEVEPLEDDPSGDQTKNRTSIDAQSAVEQLVEQADHPEKQNTDRKLTDAKVPDSATSAAADHGNDESNDDDNDDNNESNDDDNSATSAAADENDENKADNDTNTSADDDKNDDEEEDKDEDKSSSEEEENEDSNADSNWRPPPLVNGTVHEAERDGTWSEADRARQRNASTFALVMCGIVGATFVVLVAVWINRIRHRERLRSLEDHDDEEFTVFSASEARYITSSGDGYEPLR